MDSLRRSKSSLSSGEAGAQDSRLARSAGRSETPRTHSRRSVAPPCPQGERGLALGEPDRKGSRRARRRGCQVTKRWAPQGSRDAHVEDVASEETAPPATRTVETLLVIKLAGVVVALGGRRIVVAEVPPQTGLILAAERFVVIGRQDDDVLS